MILPLNPKKRDGHLWVIVFSRWLLHYHLSHMLFLHCILLFLQWAVRSMSPPLEIWQIFVASSIIGAGVMLDHKNAIHIHHVLLGHLLLEPSHHTMRKPKLDHIERPHVGVQAESPAEVLANSWDRLWDMWTKKSPDDSSPASHGESPRVWIWGPRYQEAIFAVSLNFGLTYYTTIITGTTVVNYPPVKPLGLRDNFSWVSLFYPSF